MGEINCALNSTVIAIILHIICIKMENKEINVKDLIKLGILVFVSVLLGYKLKLFDSLLKI